MTPGDGSTDTAWVSLGTNLGHRGRNLARLRETLTEHGVVIVAASPEILTRPVGVTAQADFHNQVVRLRSPGPWTPRRWLASWRICRLKLLPQKILRFKRPVRCLRVSPRVRRCYRLGCEPACA